MGFGGFGAGRVLPLRLWRLRGGLRTRAALLRVVAVFAAWLCLAAIGRAEPLSASVSFPATSGYGRMVISFAGINIMPPHQVTSQDGILVITFDDPVDIAVDNVSTVLRDYVTIARPDPEGRGLRMALARFVTVHTIDAGPQLFVDFLPRGWSGDPPGLPASVVADLARRADEAAKVAAREAMLKLEAAKPAKLTVTASRAPTFSRITFAWNVPFEANFQRTDAGVTLTFNRRATADLSLLRADLPPFVDGIDFKPSDTGTEFHVNVEPVADIRAFKDGNSYVVDVEGPLDTTALNSVDQSLLAAVGGASPPNATEMVNAGGASTAAGHDGSQTAPAHADPSATVAHPAVSDAAAHGSDGAHGSDVAPATDAAASQPPSVVPETAVASTPAPHAAADVGHAPASKPAGPDLAELPNGSAAREMNDGLVRVEAVRVGQSAHLAFPYPRPVGAAMFLRGSTAWMVFDDPSPIDSASLQDALVGFAKRIERIPVDGGQSIRIELTQPYLMTMSPDGNRWVVTIGQMVSDPARSLSILRRVGSDGSKSLDIPFGPVSKIHKLVDDRTGAPLFVVTGMGQPRGLPKPQSFAEFDAFTSIHGIALMAKVDDLMVGSDGELVTISRPGGLAVSTVAEEKKSSIVDLPKILGSSLDRKTAFVDFKNMAVADPPEYWNRRHQLMDELTQESEMPKRIAKWYELATFHLANGFGAETVGILKLIEKLAPEETASEKMAVLLAGAEVFAHRPAITVQLLEAEKYRDSPDAAVWRGMALSDLGKHDEAMAEFRNGDVVIDTFPPVVKRRYVLAEIASAIDTGDFDLARERLAKVDPKELSREDRARLDLLNALSRDAHGRASDAVTLLSGIVRGHDGEAAAEATYRLVQIQRREGLLTLDQAIDRLEQLAVSWRGDELELKTLRLLGQYSVERGNYRRAFEVMRTVEQINPQSKIAQLMNEEMQAAFAHLFLDGAADSMPPVTALTLYYDFRELTPNGRRGDAMVRKLAERLVDVDLLGQAAALLDYQVENRLRGAARAQTAADLALIYLLDRRPDKALYILAKTRQAQLPVAIERQRRIVEAKAMAVSGNIDGALELLSPFSGGEIARIKADILWQANRYADAGAAYEKLLEGRWSDTLPLSKDEQLEVLKAGISYTLQGDRLSVDRLRSKYMTKMASTANGSAFEAVTGPIVADGADFNAVIKSVGAVDTLTSFLADYRKRYLDIGGGKPGLVTDETVPAEPTPDTPASGENAQAAAPAKTTG